MRAASSGGETVWRVIKMDEGTDRAKTTQSRPIGSQAHMAISISHTRSFTVALSVDISNICLLVSFLRPANY